MKNTGPTPSVRLDVMSRNGSYCLRCNTQAGEQIHHRKPRGMGGTRDPKINDHTNLVFICQECHQHIESHRTDSYREGWLVARNASPAEQYLIDTNRRMIMLLPGGDMEAHQLPHDYDEVPF